MNKISCVENALQSVPHDAAMWSFLVTLYRAENKVTEQEARRMADKVAEEGRQSHELRAARELLRVESPAWAWLIAHINRAVGKPEAETGAYQLVAGLLEPKLIPGQPTGVVDRRVQVFIILGAGWLMNEFRSISANEVMGLKPRK